MALELVRAGGVQATGMTGMASTESAGSPVGRNSVKPVVQHVFSQALEAPAWIDDQHQIQALLYNDEVDQLSTEEHPFALFGGPGTAPHRAVRTPAPPVVWDEATALVAFRFETEPSPGPAPGSVGQLLFAARRRTALVVPMDAVLAESDGPYVLLRSGAGATVDRCPVTLGKVQYDMATIVAGPRAHDRVVVRNAFLLDAERRFRGALVGTP
jgi:hypothetical protein